MRSSKPRDSADRLPCRVAALHVLGIEPRVAERDGRRTADLGEHSWARPRSWVLRRRHHTLPARRLDIRRWYRACRRLLMPAARSVSSGLTVISSPAASSVSRRLRSRAAVLSQSSNPGRSDLRGVAITHRPPSCGTRGVTLWCAIAASSPSTPPTRPRSATPKVTNLGQTSNLRWTILST